MRKGADDDGRARASVTSWQRDGIRYALLDLPCDRSPAQFLAEQLGLSRAELEVLALVLGGMRQAAIATQRGVAHSTVRNQIASAYGKLGVGSRAELAARHGWLTGVLAHAGSERDEDPPRR